MLEQLKHTVAQKFDASCKQVMILLCLSGQEMAPTGQRPLLKDSWHQNSILWAEQFADPPIVYVK